MKRMLQNVTTWNGFIRDSWQFLLLIAGYERGKGMRASAFNTHN